MESLLAATTIWFAVTTSATTVSSAIPNGNDGIFHPERCCQHRWRYQLLHHQRYLREPCQRNRDSKPGLSAIRFIGNFIGTKAGPAFASIPNQANGILIDFRAVNTTIGGTNTFSSLPQNFIAFNKGDGIHVNRGFEYQGHRQLYSRQSRRGRLL